MTIPATGAHILVFPYPAQGHMIPLLNFTHQLATRGLTITILVTPKNLSFLRPLLSLHPSSITPLTLPFPNYLSLPLGIENHSTNQYFSVMMHAMSLLHDPLLEWWINQESAPVAIISDMFLGWTQNLARTLNVPRIVFSPSGAMALSVIYSLWRELPEKPEDENSMVTFPGIPNSPSYPWWQISLIYRKYVAGDQLMESVREGFLGDVASWGLVVNTFTDLERVYLDYLKKDLGHHRVWAVGPLLPADDDANKQGRSSSDSASEVFSWLDRCEDHSVVYVCFGSLAVLTNGQMNALALGLEKSDIKFIWCTKGNTTGNYGMVPLGFEDRTSGRGRVVRGWAPQVAILNHRAVGVFLTHCGWNSMLESISAGVPMLAWPMTADQFTDATLMVEQLGVANMVCKGTEGMPDSDDLARLFSESLAENREERVRADHLREAAVNAVKKGGSSYNDLDKLVMSFSEQG